MKTIKLILFIFFINFINNSIAQCPDGSAPLNTELVSNGDFSLGNVGFTTGYTYCNTANCATAGNTYGIGPNPVFFHPSFATYQDHTTGTGNCMVINGTDIPNTQVWCQTINSINPNTDYLFSTWVSSMWYTSPAKLQFFINGDSIGNVFNAPSTVNVWIQFFANWNSGTNTSVTICILNQNTELNGNDFGLDDISFKPCGCKNFSANAGEDLYVNAGSSVTLNATGGASYTWSPADGLSCTNCSNPTVNPQTTITYTVTVKDANGCLGKDAITVNLFNLNIPNIFTPNSDNANDYFTFSVQGLSELEGIIYDRWGEIVYQQNGLMFKWDGKMPSGTPASDGVYYYVIKSQGKDGKNYDRAGHLQLIR